MPSRSSLRRLVTRVSRSVRKLRGQFGTRSVPHVAPSVVRRNFGVKLLVGFVTVLCLVAAIGGFIYVETSQDLEANAETQLRATAKLHASQLGMWVSDSKGAARLLSGSPAVQSGDPDRIEQYFGRLLTWNTLPVGAQSIHYVNATSRRIVASTTDGRVGATFEGRGLTLGRQSLTSLATDDVLTGSFQTSTGLMHMIFVTPVPGQSDRLVVYQASVEDVATRLHQTSESAVTRVVNDEGVVVFDQQNASNVGTQYVSGTGVDTTSVSDGLLGQAGFHVTEATGGRGELVTGYASVADADWVVLVQDEPGRVFALRKRISQGIIGLVVVATVGLAIVGLTLGRSTLSSVETLASKARRMEDGDLDVDLETEREDELGDLFAAFDSMRTSLRDRIEQAREASERAREQQETAEQARQRAEEARRESEELLEHLETQAEAYREVMEAAADGDLTRRMEPDDRNEAMRRIAESFNEMIAALQSTVEEVTTFATSVHETSQRVQDSTDTARDASDEVADLVATIEADATTQHELLQQVSDEMNDLGATIEEIASSAQQVASMSETVTERGQEGREHASDAIEEMDHIAAKTDAAVESIEQLQQHTEEIVDVVELIDDIAEQTNTLALNASIEAARADTDGDGFAVVADEVKSLAEETREATADVESLVEDVRSQTESVVSEVREANRRVDDGRETVGDAVDALEAIADDLTEANAGIQEINDATDQQADSTQRVVSMVSDVAETSDATSERSSEAVEATDEQQTDLAEVSRNATELTSQATDLQTLVNEFTLERDGPYSTDGSESAPSATADRTESSPASVDRSLPEEEVAEATDETISEDGPSDVSADGTGP